MNDEQAKQALTDLLDDITKRLLPCIEKKQAKEHAKADKKCVKYKGDEYYTIDEIREAYEADLFDLATCDRLEEALEKKQDCKGGKTRADFEMDVLKSFVNSIINEKSQIMTPEETKKYYEFLEEKIK